MQQYPVVHATDGPKLVRLYPEEWQPYADPSPSERPPNINRTSSLCLWQQSDQPTPQLLFHPSKLLLNLSDSLHHPSELMWDWSSVRFGSARTSLSSVLWLSSPSVDLSAHIHVSENLKGQFKGDGGGGRLYLDQLDHILLFLQCSHFRKPFIPSPFLGFRMLSQLTLRRLQHMDSPLWVGMYFLHLLWAYISYLDQLE